MKKTIFLYIIFNFLNITFIIAQRWSVDNSIKSYIEDSTSISIMFENSLIQNENKINMYDDNQNKDGLWKSKSGFGNYIHGLKDGNWFESYNDGNSAIICFYNKGILNGTQKKYNDVYCTYYFKGITEEKVYDNGGCIKSLRYEFVRNNDNCFFYLRDYETAKDSYSFNEDSLIIRHIGYYNEFNAIEKRGDAEIQYKFYQPNHVEKIDYYHVRYRYYSPDKPHRIKTEYYHQNGKLHYTYPCQELEKDYTTSVADDVIMNDIIVPCYDENGVIYKKKTYVFNHSKINIDTYKNSVSYNKKLYGLDGTYDGKKYWKGERDSLWVYIDNAFNEIHISLYDKGILIAEELVKLTNQSNYQILDLNGKRTEYGIGWVHQVHYDKSGNLQMLDEKKITFTKLNMYQEFETPSPIGSKAFTIEEKIYKNGKILSEPPSYTSTFISLFPEVMNAFLK